MAPVVLPNIGLIFWVMGDARYCRWVNLVWRSVVPTAVMALLVSDSSHRVLLSSAPITCACNQSYCFLSYVFSVSSHRVLLSSTPNSNHLRMQPSAFFLNFSLFLWFSVYLFQATKWYSARRKIPITCTCNLLLSFSDFLCFSCVSSCLLCKFLPIFWFLRLVFLVFLNVFLLCVFTNLFIFHLRSHLTPPPPTINCMQSSHSCETHIQSHLKIRYPSIHIYLQNWKME